MSRPIFTIVGATGAQGGSIVEAALKAGTYSVRAITRNTNSDKAKALAARGVEVVSADLNNELSLLKAFEVCNSPTRIFCPFYPTLESCTNFS